MIVAHNKQFSRLGLRSHIGMKGSAAVTSSSLGLSDLSYCLHKG